MKTLLYIIFISFAVFGQEKPSKYVDFFSINDVDFSVLDNPKYKRYYKKIDKRVFFKKYFSVWNTELKITDKEQKAFFDYNYLSRKSACYSENNKPYSKELINEIKSNIVSLKINTIIPIKRALITSTTDIRILPTNEFCFKNIRNAGEGYPFDYFQNSSIWIGTPVSILTTTNDGMWCFIYSNSNKGWVKKEDLALVSNEQAIALQNMDFVTPSHDKVLVKNDFFSKYIYIGSLLPTHIKNNKMTVLVPKANHKNNYVVYDTIEVNKGNFDMFPIKFTKENVKKIATELYHHKYTWGGLNNGRDCSSHIKDFFTPFGLWMPRNSGEQRDEGKKIKLKGSNSNKLHTIITKGVPFLSSVYKKGHIMLYIGMSKRNNTPLIYHNVWGIKVFHKNKDLDKVEAKRDLYGLYGIHKKIENKSIETRLNIGKAVITNIEPSKKIDNTFSQITTESYLTNLKTLIIHK